MLKIVNNISKQFDMTKNEFRRNPIAAYLARHIEERLAYAYRREADDVDALVISDFEFKEDGGTVNLMRLSFNVRSWGYDVLKDEDCLRTFEKVCQEEFNCSKIRLTHYPNGEFGFAIYETERLADMMSLLEAFESVGIDVETTFKFVDKPFRERRSVARIGFFGKGRTYEVYVRTDDTCRVPHFHVRNIYTEEDTPIFFLTNYYCPHTDRDCCVLEDGVLLMLHHFMADKCSSKHFKDNYECAVMMWNMNNEADCWLPSGYKIPDYSHTTFIEDVNISGSRVYVDNGEVNVQFNENIQSTGYMTVEEAKQITLTKFELFYKTNIKNKNDDNS